MLLRSYQKMVICFVFTVLSLSCLSSSVYAKDYFLSNSDVISIRAEKGFVRSQTVLGYLYLVEQDVVQARKWFEAAANQGSVIGQTALGYMYFNGLVESGEDKEKAAYWFSLASAQKNSHTAKRYLSLLCQSSVTYEQCSISE